MFHQEKRLIGMRAVVMLALMASLLGGLALAPHASANNGTLWTAEYYNNTTLTGAPAVVQQVQAVGFDWTATAPVAGINVDYFGARYTGVPTLNAGAYTISVRADDGVRVYLDGQLVINQFGTSTGLTYTYSFTAAAGQHVIVVEYFEGGGVAYLNFGLDYYGTGGPVTGANGTVTAWALNVRNVPSVYTGAVITRISRGQVVPIVGRNGDGSWWQITANGVTGWVSGVYLSAVNTQNVPITDGTLPPPVTNFTATAFLNLNIRSGPSTNYGVIGWLPLHQAARIIGRNATNTWWQVTYGRYTGWVSAAYTSVYPTTGVNAIPITDTGTPPPPTSFTASTVGNLNIRTGPNAAYPRVSWLPIYNTVTVFGRNAVNTWYQIQYAGVTGWVSGSYLSFAPGTNIYEIPVTG